ncbi:hypothetical protein KQX54_018988 [Cotesia glomerata]|uniref:Uncharacterized protein n=1 Tax=Cotesia glomerata TaxID=32391 RepID=A0AAV7HLD8_COTGL|nr:hypothetical protein KQX54_018988 [Cotesia glomerata]
MKPTIGNQQIVKGPLKRRHGLNGNLSLDQEVNLGCKLGDASGAEEMRLGILLQDVCSGDPGASNPMLPSYNQLKLSCLKFWYLASYKNLHSTYTLVVMGKNTDEILAHLEVITETKPAEESGVGIENFKIYDTTSKLSEMTLDKTQVLLLLLLFIFLILVLFFEDRVIFLQERDHLPRDWD